jgi:inorganic phosphate transporter, PiT family
VSLETGLLVVAAIGFAVVSGMNDGAALFAIALRAPSRRVATFAVLVLLVVVTPFVIGTEVATTLANRLVTFGTAVDTETAHLALAVAVVGGVAVVALLSRLGLPTSLTLALIGGITGAGVGFGLPVSWSTVALVLAIGALAPVAGGTIGAGLRSAARLLPARGSAHRRLRLAHDVAFAVQCFAYGANDGQKMLAVAAVALGTALPTVAADPAQLAAIGALFGVGTLLGLRGMATTLGTGVLIARPFHVISAELSAGVAVLGSTVVGAPVSMTQAVTGGLVGSGLSEGLTRIRWKLALRVAAAWVVTLPAAGLVAGVVGWAVTSVRG